jgi:hypothetical protein
MTKAARYDVTGECCSERVMLRVYVSAIGSSGLSNP